MGTPLGGAQGREVGIAEHCHSMAHKRMGDTWFLAFDEGIRDHCALTFGSLTKSPPLGLAW